MHLFGWLDLRTLVACQLPLAAVFAIALFAIKRIYLQLRGIDLLAIGFALSVPATALIVAQGSIPGFAAVIGIGGNLLTIGGYVLLYRGLLVFFDSKGALALLYDTASIAAAVIVYFTVVYDLAFPRIVTLSLIVALVRALIAVELLRKARGRTTMLCFAGFLILFAVLPVSAALFSLFNEAALSHTGLEAINGLSGTVFLSGCGLFILTLCLDEAGQNAQQTRPYDELTGTFNRHAIEDALTVEIARANRTHSPVSVMLVEIDFFNSMSAIHGRAKIDQTLCTVVSTIGGMLRFYDKCGRLADDRFLVVLPENAAEHALVIANRFRAAMKSPDLPHDQPAVTLSIGVTQSAFKELTADVLARAEEALIEARKKGHDCAHLEFNIHQHLHAPPTDGLASSRETAKASR